MSKLLHYSDDMFYRFLLQGFCVYVTFTFIASTILTHLYCTHFLKISCDGIERYYKCGSETSSLKNMKRAHCICLNELCRFWRCLISYMLLVLNFNFQFNYILFKITTCFLFQARLNHDSRFSSLMCNLQSDCATFNSRSIRTPVLFHFNLSNRLLLVPTIKPPFH